MILRRLSLWLALGVSMCGGAARAADDAGTRSAFDFGAGSRGLGMGSAFVAAVDDASAITWNAAGLGAVRRSEFLVVQSADWGLGFQDNFVAVVIPSWRWGTSALSLRTFGVSGIERRDERNTLLADDLSDRELELSLGYGRGWGPALQLGGAFKVRRQTLAGLGASGLGIDLGAQVRPAVALGVQAPWAAEWCWGLSLHNLVPPTLRLDREPSTDATSVRSGIAWRREAGPWGAVLGELDVETTRDVGLRTCFGAEYRPNDWIAIRGGAEPRGVSAGTSVRWHDVSIDYAFQDAPLADEHRIGLSYQFGASVEESRVAALRREDDALQRRLAQAFQERQSRQVDELLARARDARERGEPDDALDALGAVRMLEPGLPAAQALEVGCLDDKGAVLERAGDLAGAAMTYDQALLSDPADATALAGSSRCRAELERRTARSQEMRQSFARALDAFAADHLDSARAGFEDLVRQNPGDADAALMLRRTQEALARRAAQARTVRPAPPPPLPATSSAPKHPTYSAESEARVEALYRQGIAAWREQRSDDALRYWELVWSARPGYRQVNAFLLREYLTRGIDAFAAGRLPEAIAQWERALRVDPTDARARSYLARAQEQLARSRAISGSQ